MDRQQHDEQRPTAMTLTGEEVAVRAAANEAAAVAGAAIARGQGVHLLREAVSCLFGRA